MSLFSRHRHLSCNAKKSFQNPICGVTCAAGNCQHNSRAAEGSVFKLPDENAGCGGSEYGADNFKKHKNTVKPKLIGSRFRVHACLGATECVFEIAFTFYGFGYPPPHLGMPGLGQGFKSYNRQFFSAKELSTTLRTKDLIFYIKQKF